MKSSHPGVYSSNTPVSSTSFHKHLGMLHDNKLSKVISYDYELRYEHHLKFLLNKVKKTISLLHKNLKSIQYNAVIVITGTKKRTSSEKLFQELAFEFIKLSRWLRKLCKFYKFFS